MKCFLRRRKKRKFNRKCINRSELIKLSFHLEPGDELFLYNFWGRPIMHFTRFNGPDVNINGKSFTFRCAGGFSFKYHHIGLCLISDLYKSDDDSRRFTLFLNNAFGLNIKIPKTVRVKTDGELRKN